MPHHTAVTMNACRITRIIPTRAPASLLQELELLHEEVGEALRRKAFDADALEREEAALREALRQLPAEGEPAAGAQASSPARRGSLTSPTRKRGCTTACAAGGARASTAGKRGRASAVGGADGGELDSHAEPAASDGADGGGGGVWARKEEARRLDAAVSAQRKTDIARVEAAMRRVVHAPPEFAESQSASFAERQASVQALQEDLALLVDAEVKARERLSKLASRLGREPVFELPPPPTPRPAAAAQPAAAAPPSPDSVDTKAAGAAKPMPPSLATPALPAGPKPTKPVIRPAMKMKGLHWKRVLLSQEARKRREEGEGEAETVWERLADACFDAAAFEELFSVRKNAAAEAAPKPKAALTKALDPKRSNAVAIMMSSLPPVNEVRLAIVSLDEGVLSREQLEKLRLNLPTPEEMEEIARLDGPDVKWDRPEQFLKIVMRVPRVRVRLRCWAIKYSFSEKVEELEDPLRTVLEAIGELRECPALRPLFGLFLALGNHLNGGTNKGQADGFMLADIPKFSLTKDNTNSFTLLEYGVRLIHAADAASPVLSIGPSLPHLKEAAKANVAELKGLLAKLSADAKELERAIVPPAGESRARGGEGGEGGGVGNDPFFAVMADFAEYAAAEVTKLSELVAQVDSAFADLVGFLAASSKQKVEPDELFSLFSELIDAVALATPKSKPAPAASATGGWRLVRDAATKGAAGLAEKAAAEGGDAAGGSDPMMSRMQNMRARKQSIRTDGARSLREPALAPGKAVGRDAASAGKGSKEATAPLAKDGGGTQLDQQLQKRLEARFQKAKGARESRSTPFGREPG